MSEAGPAKCGGMLELESEFTEGVFNRQLGCSSYVELKCT